MSLLDEAIKFAVDAHSGMTRKRSGVPFIMHPMEAAAIVATLTKDEEVISAAVLHDVVEDTPFTLDDIERRFGPRVAALVASETEAKHRERPAAETWRMRKEESLKVLRNTDDLNIKLLWLGDKLSNMRAFSHAHRHEGAAMWNAFNQKDPAQQEWYYRSIAELLGELSYSDAWKEYASLVDEVFGEEK